MRLLKNPPLTVADADVEEDEELFIIIFLSSPPPDGERRLCRWDNVPPDTDAAEDADCPDP